MSQPVFGELTGQDAVVEQLSRAAAAASLLLAGDRPAGEITRDIQERIRGMLPDPVPSVAEAATGDFPAIKESDEPARFR